MKSSIWWMRVGMPFQLVACAMYVVRFYGFERVEELPIFIWMAEKTGTVGFVLCLAILYPLHNEPRVLITDGLFRYTRHPMYTALVLMDLPAFWSSETGTARHMATTFLLYLSLAIAAWCQEKETLARYGHEAEEYYRRTPRFILWYPIVHCLNRLRKRANE